MKRKKTKEFTCLDSKRGFHCFYFSSSSSSSSQSSSKSSASSILILALLHFLVFTSNLASAWKNDNQNDGFSQLSTANNNENNNNGGHQPQQEQMTTRNGNQYKTGYACEGSKLKISCDEFSQINLIRANFGRFSISICNQHGNLDWSVNCMSPDSFKFIKNDCSRKRDCLLPASSGFFGDPCPGTYKYLEVHYECVPNSPTSQHRSKSIYGPGGDSHSGSNSGRNSNSNQNYNHNLNRHHNFTFGFGGPSKSSKAGMSPPPIIIPTLNPSNKVMMTTTGSSSPSSSSSSTLPPSLLGPPSLLAKNTDVGHSDERPLITITSSPSSSPSSSSSLSSPSPGSASSSSSASEAVVPMMIIPGINGETPPETTSQVKYDEKAIYVPHPYPRFTTSGPETSLSSSSSSSSFPSSGHHDQGNINAILQVGGGGSGSGSKDSPNGSPNDPQGEGSVGINVPPSSSFAFPPPPPPVSNSNDPLLSDHCPPATARGLRWNYTAVGHIAYQSCPGGSKGYAKWYCSRDSPTPEWIPPKPDFSDCSSLWMMNLEERLGHRDWSLVGLGTELASMTAEKTLYGGDVFRATDIINQLVTRLETAVDEVPDDKQRNQVVKELLTSIQETCSNLLDGVHQESWFELPPIERKGAASSLVYALERNAMLISDGLNPEESSGVHANGTDVIRVHRNIYLGLHVRQTEDINVYHENGIDLPLIERSTERNGHQQPHHHHHHQKLHQEPSEWWSSSSSSSFTPSSTSAASQMSNKYEHHFTGNSVHLPQEALLNSAQNGFVKILLVIYKRLDSILEPELIRDHNPQSGTGSHLAAAGSSSPPSKTTNVTTILNSDIIGITLTGGTTGRHAYISSSSNTGGSSLGYGVRVRITLRHLLIKDVSRPQCVFWDTEKRDWSTAGCILASSNLTHSVCECNHLTNFALFMDINDPSARSGSGRGNGGGSGSHHLDSLDGHQSDSQSRTIITALIIIGSLISIIFLFISFMTMITLFKREKSQHRLSTPTPSSASTVVVTSSSVAAATHQNSLPVNTDNTLTLGGHNNYECSLIHKHVSFTLLIHQIIYLSLVLLIQMNPVDTFDHPCNPIGFHLLVIHYFFIVASVWLILDALESYQQLSFFTSSSSSSSSSGAAAAATSSSSSSSSSSSYSSSSCSSATITTGVAAVTPSCAQRANAVNNLDHKWKSYVDKGWSLLLTYVGPLILLLFLICIASPSSESTSFAFKLLVKLCLLHHESYFPSLVSTYTIIVLLTSSFILCLSLRKVKSNSLRASPNNSPPPPPMFAIVTTTGSTGTGSVATATTTAAGAPTAPGSGSVSDTTKNHLESLTRRMVKLSVSLRFLLTVLALINWTLEILYFVHPSLLFLGFLFSLTNLLLGPSVFIFYCLINVRIRSKYLELSESIKWLPGSCFGSGQKPEYLDNQAYGAGIGLGGCCEPSGILCPQTPTSVDKSGVRLMIGHHCPPSDQPIINSSTSMGTLTATLAAATPGSAAAGARDLLGSKYYLVGGSLSGSDTLESGSDYGCRRLQLGMSTTAINNAASVPPTAPGGNHHFYHVYAPKQPCNPYSCHHIIEHVYECIDDDPYVAKVLLPSASNSSNYRLQQTHRHTDHSTASLGHHLIRNPGIHHQLQQQHQQHQKHHQVNLGQFKSSEAIHHGHFQRNSSGQQQQQQHQHQQTFGTLGHKSRIINQGGAGHFGLPAIVKDNNGRTTIICSKPSADHHHNHQQQQQLQQQNQQQQHAAAVLAVLSPNNKIVSCSSPREQLQHQKQHQQQQHQQQQSQQLGIDI